MKIQQNTNFTIRVKTFIKSVCLQRIYLCQTGKSNLSDPKIFDIAKGLKNDAEMLVVDKQTANFLQRRSADLISLIPGKNCKGIEKRLRQFNFLKQEAEVILNS